MARPPLIPDLFESLETMRFGLALWKNLNEVQEQVISEKLEAGMLKVLKRDELDKLDVNV